MQSIKYPHSLFKTASLEGWEKEFLLLMDLKRIFKQSHIKNYKDFFGVNNRLCHKLSRETYFKYLHFLNRLELLKINYNTIKLKRYDEYGDTFRYVKACKNSLTRMCGQRLRRLCEKQQSKIRTKSSIVEKRQLKEQCSTITFDIVDVASLVTMSCKTLGNLFGKSKTWGYVLKQRLKALGFLVITNRKEYLGTDVPSQELLAKRKVKFFSGVWFMQLADEIKCSILYDERDSLVDFLDSHTKTHYLYCNDLTGDGLRRRK